MDSSASVFTCSSSSGEISSAKPVKVHTCCYPFPEGCTPIAERGSSMPVPFLETYGPTGTGRLVDALDYREGLASFLEVHGRLAVLSYGLDEIPDLVTVRHREAGRVCAGAGSGTPLAILLYDLRSLILTPICAVGVSLPSLAGVKVH